jgi:hypothetical protein
MVVAGAGSVLLGELVLDASTRRRQAARAHMITVCAGPTPDRRCERDKET